MEIKFINVQEKSKRKEDESNNEAGKKVKNVDKLMKVIEKEKQKQQLNYLLEDCVKKWCEDTTSHGFSNMVKTDSWIIRIIWIILIILSMGYCIYSVYLIFVSYLSFSVVTSYQIITESPADFPAVTICNLNPFDVTAESGTGAYINKVLSSNSISPTINVTGLTDTYAIKEVDDAANVLKAAVTADKTLNDTELKKKGFSFEKMLISCYFNKIKCDSSDFNWKHTHQYGNCYTFNDLYVNGTSMNSKTTSKPGPEYALNLEMFIGLGGRNDYYTFKKGVHVFVHERGMIPIINNEGIDVMASTATNIAISKTKYSKYSPYSNCRQDVTSILSTDSDLYKDTIKISKYRQRLCYELCAQKLYIIPKCNCADPTIPITDTNQTICGNKTTISCVKEQRDYLDKIDISEECDSYCPLECDSTSYSLNLDSASYPTDYYWDIFKSQPNIAGKVVIPNSFTPQAMNNPPMGRRRRGAPVAPPATTPIQNQQPSQATTNMGSQPNQPPDQATTNMGSKPNQPQGQAKTNMVPDSNPPIDVSSVKNSVLKISIFFRELRYTSIQESPSMDFLTLIGVIGGQFGLFMGASFLSFAEVLEMLINLVRVTIHYCKMKKQIFQDINK